jgi:hypothetical protein
MFRFYVLVFTILLPIFQPVEAGLYEGIHLFEQQKYAEACQELYPLKGINLYAHPYILDLHLHHNLPLTQDDIVYLNETTSLITKGNLEASKAYIKIQRKCNSKKKVNIKKEINELEILTTNRISRAQYLLGKLIKEGKIGTQSQAHQKANDLSEHHYYFLASSNGDIDAMQKLVQRLDSIKDAKAKETFKLAIFQTMNADIGNKYISNYSLIVKKISAQASIPEIYSLLAQLYKDKNHSFYFNLLLSAAGWGDESALRHFEDLLALSLYPDEKITPFYYQKKGKQDGQDVLFAIPFKEHTSNHIMTIIHFLAYKNRPKIQFYLAQLYDPDERSNRWRQSDAPQICASHSSALNVVNIKTKKETSSFWSEKAAQNGWYDAKILETEEKYQIFIKLDPNFTTKEESDIGNHLIFLYHEAFFNLSTQNSFVPEDMKDEITQRCTMFYTCFFNIFNEEAQKKLAQIIQKGSEAGMHQPCCCTIMAEIHALERADYPFDLTKIIDYLEKGKSYAPFVGLNLASIYLTGNFGYEVTTESIKKAEQIYQDLLQEEKSTEEQAELHFKLFLLYSDYYNEDEPHHTNYKARDHLLKAARLGQKEAMTLLAFKYISEDYYRSHLELKEVIDYIKHAHEEGYAYASLFYSILKMLGYDQEVDRNLDESHQILQDIATQPENNASENARLMLEFFETTEKGSNNNDILMPKDDHSLSSADASLQETILSIKEEVNLSHIGSVLSSPEESSSESEDEQHCEIEMVEGHIGKTKIYDADTETIQTENMEESLAQDRKESILDPDFDPVSIHKKYQELKKFQAENATSMCEETQSSFQPRKKKGRKLLDKFKGTYASKMTHAQLIQLTNVLAKDFKTKVTTSKGSNIHFEIGDNILNIHKPGHSNVGRLNFGRTKSIKGLLNHLDDQES